MKKSEILKDAKRQLWDGSEPIFGREKYICHAIEYDGDHDRPEKSKVRELLIYVNRCLNGHYSYEGYLDHRHGRPYRDSLNTVQIQAMRHQLLNEMIAEYEGKGE